MQYGFVIPTGDPRTVADLAREAEHAGWDAVFTWDGIYVGDTMPVYDPWVVMAGMAMATERIRIGAMLSPLSRRRPWKVARETVSLDHLSTGRLILPVGLGAGETFGNVGEETNQRVRAELLDESLAILNGLWSGEPFSFEGKHYQIGEMTFVPKPVQQPRIPIWVVGRRASERSMQRVIACDGMIIEESLTPAHVRDIAAYVSIRRTSEMPFDIIIQAGSDYSTTNIQQLSDAGATWWIDSQWTEPNDPEIIRKRLRQGRPAV
jgi:alkanesulfonate monooxygenase SsuD/methylene tetrahydromethanopterin reductase-like flavin-dependent oxidoreductase (luciferase family)